MAGYRPCGHTGRLHTDETDIRLQSTAWCDWSANGGGNPLPQQHAVFGDHRAHGSSALTRVPWPGGLSTRSRPPIACTRSASPRSPVPPSVVAPPTPSSVISTTRPTSSGESSMTAAEAWACLVMLVRLSATI
jgi:hypothetical protein